MSRSTRTYGKQSRNAKVERLFADLPQSPVRRGKIEQTRKRDAEEDSMSKLVEQLTVLDIQDENSPALNLPGSEHDAPKRPTSSGRTPAILEPFDTATQPPTIEVDNPSQKNEAAESEPAPSHLISSTDVEAPEALDSLRILTWHDICPPGSTIAKIAEASYAEVYRIANPNGISIIKVIRLLSPIKPQTKAQQRAGLVDEEPHAASDLQGELRISEWLADIPGFVVYKERYVVQGRAPRALIDTHQAFHRRAKRQDPDRLQFYPSPTRYLDGTRFLVVELGDAGTALEDFALERSEQLWDVFLLVAIALARGEDLVSFEHRDLHEGNLCIRRTRELAQQEEEDKRDRGSVFGYSGLDITILDYGLSRAEEPLLADETTSTSTGGGAVAYDLDKDLSLFTSTHAPQCAVYRRMRSFLLTGRRCHLAPDAHHTSYAVGVTGEPLSWDDYVPYTNVLWLGYIYQYLVAHFRGEKKILASFQRATKELWAHLDPEAGADVPCFGSAGEVVHFAVESGWLKEEELLGVDGTLVTELEREREDSIVVLWEEEHSVVLAEADELGLRRSPRKKQPRHF